MTADRRPLLVLPAAAALLLPACISVHARPLPVAPPDAAAKIAEGAAKAAEQPRKSDFAVYPSRPGEAVPTKPGAADATTAQKPNPAGPVAPGVTTAGEPGAFPLAPTRPPLPAEPPLLAAVRAYAEGKPERAYEYIAALDKPNQEFVLALLPALVRGATADLAGDPVGIALIAEQLHSAALRLEPRAALRVGVVAFCNTVDMFGRYEPRPDNQPYRPNDEAQLYVTREDNLYLVGTSEVSLASLHAGEVLDQGELPRRYLGYSTCFRREAGTYGKDTRGIFRLHQFDKLEMFSFVLPERSEEEHDRLLAYEEEFVRSLGIPYRVVNVCTGELGASAAKKYDIEAWLPGQGRYREITSTSNTTDYQARRLECRVRLPEGNRPVHTLNGTLTAIGRTLIAVLENGQREDGSVELPETLRPYLPERDWTLGPPG